MYLLVRSRNLANGVLHQVGSLVLAHGFKRFLLHFALQLWWDAESAEGQRSGLQGAWHRGKLYSQGDIPAHGSNEEDDRHNNIRACACHRD